MPVKFLIITHVQHISKDHLFFGYAPYVNEMNLWTKYCDEVIIVAPLSKEKLNPIYAAYVAKKLIFVKIPSFSLVNFKEIIFSFFAIPIILWKLVVAMRKADHIHLRCPGNIGLLASIVQIFFPKKIKTAKYAGNWDPKSKQPWSYRMQKWLLSSTFLTKNMQVLVYGEWENQSKNIKPFFTATYKNSDITETEVKDLNGIIRFLFVGTLSPGKQPLYALELVYNLHKKGYSVHLDFYGEGNQRNSVESYITKNQLQEVVHLKGNQAKEDVEKAYKESHFLILPSKSEGWPKVVAEAMFWNCLPIVTKVSCVPYMLENGNRGILLNEDLDTDVQQVVAVIEKPLLYKEITRQATEWSRQFTTDKFEREIKKLL